MCSTQSENLRNLNDCVAHSQNPEIAHYSCMILRLCNTLARSRDCTTIVRNLLSRRACPLVLRDQESYKKMATLCKIAEFTQSPDCAHVSHNLEIAHMCHSILRLCTSVTQSRDCLRKLGILRMRNAISRLRKFSDCAEHKHSMYEP